MVDWSNLSVTPTGELQNRLAQLETWHEKEKAQLSKLADSTAALEETCQTQQELTAQAEAALETQRQFEQQARADLEKHQARYNRQQLTVTAGNTELDRVRQALLDRGIKATAAEPVDMTLWAPRQGKGKSLCYYPLSPLTRELMLFLYRADRAQQPATFWALHNYAVNRLGYTVHEPKRTTDQALLNLLRGWSSGDKSPLWINPLPGKGQLRDPKTGKVRDFEIRLNPRGLAAAEATVEYIRSGKSATERSFRKGKELPLPELL